MDGLEQEKYQGKYSLVIFISMKMSFGAVPDPMQINTAEARKIALDNGIHNVETPDRAEGQFGSNIALAAIIGQGGSGGALGLTRGKILITTNDFSARTVAHELGHTFGLSDNYPYNNGGLMDYPAGAISTIDVDEIIYKAYVKK